MILRNKYKAAQTHLSVTPEMRERLLQAVREEPQKAVKKPVPHFGQTLRRVAALAACVVLAACAVQLLPHLTAPEPALPDTSDSTSVSAAPLTPADVQKALDFTLAAPSALPEGYTLTDYAKAAHAVRLSYTDGDAEITYAMSARVAYPDAVGSPVEDALRIIPADCGSGTTVTVGERFVTLYGAADAYLYAEWYDMDTDYQLAFSAPRGADEIAALIESVKPCK